MVKTRIVKKTRRLKRLLSLSRKKLNSKKRGRGKVHELPFLIKTMLNNVNVKANNAEFYEKGIMEKIMTMVPKRDVVKAILTKTLADKAKADKVIATKVNADKAEYERRILAALPLNEKILKTQEAEIKRLEMSGLDGPARRTRSGVNPATNPVLEELRLEAYHTRMVIMRLQYLARKIREGETSVPSYYKDYAEFLKGNPGWDMERMAYVRRERPPGYENYDKLKAKAKTEAEAKAKAKAEAKAETKVETTEDPVKLKKLALELYKKSSAMKARAKKDIIEMGRDVDKERIDIMLEENFYGLNNKQLEAWIAKARIQAKK